MTVLSTGTAAVSEAGRGPERQRHVHHLERVLPPGVREFGGRFVSSREVLMSVRDAAHLVGLEVVELRRRLDKQQVVRASSLFVELRQTHVCAVRRAPEEVKADAVNP